MSLETVTKKKLYEGMFLVDSATAGADWDGIIAAIKRILERAEAEIISIRKWDDRRLAYEIKHVARGTYLLTYFRASGEKIQGIEKDVNLSEKILRVLILTAEHLTAEDMEKDTPALKAEKEGGTSSPAGEPVAEEETRSPGDLREAPAVEEELLEAEEVEVDEDAGEEEEEPQSRPVMDD
ncbi:MAG: 30S ribosomal protein S6 [Planctomycetes bacterium RBG_16_55_9]|nr:MAG: 30S ribosomal protein S6 [Planctomycetes bacterium RBG_16_55_9]